MDRGPLPSQVLPRVPVLNHPGDRQDLPWMSYLGGIGEEGRSRVERGGGKADKRDQLLFAHKPQVDNE